MISIAFLTCAGVPTTRQRSLARQPLAPRSMSTATPVVSRMFRNRVPSRTDDGARRVRARNHLFDDGDVSIRALFPRIGDHLLYYRLSHLDAIAAVR